MTRLPEVDLVPIGHVELVPRRIRATLGSEAVIDSTRVLYVWENSHYPQFYVPLDDVRRGVLVAEGPASTELGSGTSYGVKLGTVEREGAGVLYDTHPNPRLVNHVRFRWSAFDAWFEEAQRVHVHPRSPYVRVDVLRSDRLVRVELDGFVLAESDAPVLVFETGLATRYYLDRGRIDFSRLIASDTVTSCPYKGTTSGYWSARGDGRIVPDVAWSYDFPLPEVAPLAGLVGFYHEKLNVTVDGVPV